MLYMALIGQGVSGCVYSPPLPCRLACRSRHCREGVSKFTTIQSAERQFAKSQLIDRIDPTGQFHIGAPYQCSVDLASQPQNCSVVPPAPDRRLLIYQHGGMNLHDYLRLIYRDPAQALRLVVSLNNVAVGIARLADSKLVHRDIKPENIVVGVRPGDSAKRSSVSFGDPLDASAPLPKLIDFGLSGSAQALRAVPDQVYPFWPWEQFLLSLPPSTPREQLVRWLAKYLNDPVVDEYYLSYFPQRKSADQYERALSQLLSLDHEQRQSLISSRFDVFSFGITLLYVLHPLSRVLPEDLVDQLYELAQRMTRVSPSRRPSARQVALQYLQITKPQMPAASHRQWMSYLNNRRTGLSARRAST